MTSEASTMRHPVSPRRRSVLAAAAWAVPTVSLSVATPAHAATSGNSTSTKLAQRRVQPGDTTTLTVTVVDGRGLPISGRAVAVTSSASGFTATPSSGATDAQGTFQATIAVGTSVAMGDYVISASTTDGTTSTTLSVAGALLLTLAADRMRSDRSLAATVRLIDEQAQPVADHSITFEGSGPLRFEHKYDGTDEQGTVANVLQGTGPGQPGPHTVSVSTDEGQSDEVTITVVDALELSISTDKIEQGGTAVATVACYNTSANPRSKRAVTISVTELDEYGEAVPSTAITHPSTVTTGSNGRATITLVAASTAQPQTYTVTATAGSDTASVTLEVLPPVVPVAMSLSPTVVPWGGTGQLTVTATNSDRSPAVGAHVTISSSSTDVVVSPTSGNTDANGVFSAVATVSSSPSASGVRQLTATAGSASGTVDLWIDAVRQRIAIPPRPSDVLLVGSTLWVLDPVAGALKAIDTSTNTLTRTVTLPAACYALGASSESNAARLCLFPGDGRIFVYDIATNAVVSTITRPGGGTEIYQISTHDSVGRVYAAAPRDGVVMVIDVAGNTLLTQVTGDWPMAVAGGRGALADRFYFVDSNGILRAIRTSDNTQTSTLDLGANVDSDARMTVSANGQRAYIATSSGQDPAQVVVVDLVGWTVLARVPIIGEHVVDIVLTPDGQRVLVLAKTVDTITAVSTSTIQVVASWNPGPSAASLAVLSNTTAYTGDYDQANPGVSVIDIR